MTLFLVSHSRMFSTFNLPFRKVGEVDLELLKSVLSLHPPEYSIRSTISGYHGWIRIQTIPQGHKHHAFFTPKVTIYINKRIKKKKVLCLLLQPYSLSPPLQRPTETIANHLLPDLVRDCGTILSREMGVLRYDSLMYSDMRGTGTNFTCDIYIG